MAARTAKKTTTSTAAKKTETAYQSPVEKYWALRLQTAKEAFEDNHYLVSIVQTLDEARRLVLDSIIPGLNPGSISFGGSHTVSASGLTADLIAQKDIPVINTVEYTIPPEELYERRRQALLVDLLFCSVNGATMDGKLVLLDGIGNRSAAVQFGPKNVVLFISRNKLVENLSDAMERTRTMAAPMNGLRLQRKTPCAKVGECMDCNSPERLCNAWTIMEKCPKKHRIHIVLINTDAGY